MVYISENITKEQCAEWLEQNSKVFLSAMTGSGKSFFVIHRLLPFLCKEQHKKVLILLPRTALAQQYNKDYEDFLNDQIDQFEEIYGYVAILTYQKLENLIVEGRAEEYSKFDVVISDESHYFLVDAQFNAKTDLSMCWIAENFRHNFVLFISATMQNVLPVIRSKLDMFPDGAFLTRGSPVQKHNFQCVQIPARYDYLDIVLEKDKMKILENIARSKAKALIFVKSKKEAKKMINCILQINQNKKVGFLDSKEAHSNLAKYVNNGRQQFDILLTTTVLDVGFSISDKEVKLIYIQQILYETYLQCLGRKRVKEGERVTLFLYNPTKKIFKNHAQLAKCVVSEYWKFMQTGQSLQNYVAANYCSIDHGMFAHLIYKGKGKIEVGENCLKFYMYSGSFAWKMYKELREGNEERFLDVQLHWLGRNQNEVFCEAESRKDCVSKLTNFLTENMNASWMGTKKRDSFINEQIKPILGDLFKNYIDTTGKLTFNKLNSLLTENNIPIQMVKSGKPVIYRFERTEIHK